MTNEQLAVLHGMSVDTVKYRKRHGIPLDYPLNKAWRKRGRPKGTEPLQTCKCGAQFNLGCYWCPRCDRLSTTGRSAQVRAARRTQVGGIATRTCRSCGVTREADKFHGRMLCIYC